MDDRLPDDAESEEHFAVPVHQRVASSSEAAFVSSGTFMFGAQHEARNSSLQALIRQGTTGIEAVLKLNTFYEKVASSFVYVIMFSVSLTLIYLSFVEFFRYKVNTRVDLNDYWQNGSTPPALTICNVNGFKKSIFCSEKHSKLTGNLCKIRDKTKFGSEFLKFMGDSRAYSKLVRIAQKASMTSSETIKSCFLGGHLCDNHTIRDTVFAFHRYGTCFCLFCDEPRKKWVAGRGRSPETGLSVVLDSREKDTLSSSATAGFLLLIHDYSILPDTNLNGIYLSNARTSYVALSRRQVQRLPLPYSTKCDDNWPKVYRKFVEGQNYSKQLCIKLCTTLHMAAQCGCPLSKDLQFEQLLDSDVFCQESPRIRNCSLRAAQGRIECPCTPKCVEYIYEWNISNAGWHYTRKADSLTRLVVYFAITAREEIIQEPKFRFRTCFSLLGGYFGMFVGCSFLILYELSEINLRWLVAKLSRK